MPRLLSVASPVRIGIAVRPDSLGRRHAQITAWRDAAPAASVPVDEGSSTWLKNRGGRKP